MSECEVKWYRNRHHCDMDLGDSHLDKYGQYRVVGFMAIGYDRNLDRLVGFSDEFRWGTGERLCSSE